MYQPSDPLPQYPASAPSGTAPRRPVPPQVRNAIRAMYVGAVVTSAGVAVEIATVGATKATIQHRSRHLTANQLNLAGHALVIGFAVSGLIAVAAWLIIARASRHGRNWARLTGTALFVLATIDTLASVRGPLAGPVRACWPVIWLTGLIAVIFLWQPRSAAWFRSQELA